MRRNKTAKQLLLEQEENVREHETVSCHEKLQSIESRRFIKTHLPFSLLPPSVMEQQSKVIYVARNPKDVIVSNYHLARSLRFIGYTGEFSKYCGYFLKNLVFYAPYFEHINEGWQHRSAPNVLFMFYEDMIKVRLTLMISSWGIN